MVPNVVSLQKMAPKVCRKTSEDHNFGGHTTKVVSSPTFWASLRKFGQKSFAPPKFACSYTYDCKNEKNTWPSQADLFTVNANNLQYAPRYADSNRTVRSRKIGRCSFHDNHQRFENQANLSNK